MQAREFERLFRGSSRAHGRFEIFEKQNDPTKVKGRVETIDEPPNADLWQAHLAGETGLGVIPIMENGTCFFAGIDIDEYDLDLLLLESRLRIYNIPCVLCRTKSGGAHLYFFFKKPIPAKIIRKKLGEFSLALGYPGVEIFPKQDELLGNEVGNWINMPYFMGKDTNRYAIYDGQKLSIKEFLKRAREVRLSKTQLQRFKIEKTGPLADGPPCLEVLCEKGFPEGSMNNSLFSMAVYAKYKYPENWDEIVRKYNEEYMGPGSNYEVNNIIKQLKKKEFFYKCKDLPLKDYCNKELCKDRPFGISALLITFEVYNLIKVETDPVCWKVTVKIDEMEPATIELSTPELQKFDAFQKCCLEQGSCFPPAVKAANWQKVISGLLENMEIEEAADDSGISGYFLDLIRTFFSRTIAKSKDKIILGKTWKNEGRIYFSSKDMMKYLYMEGFHSYSVSDCWHILKRVGVDSEKIIVRGRRYSLWNVPEDFADIEENIPTDHIENETEF